MTRDIYVGIDVAFAKRKRLPVCFLSRNNENVEPLFVRSLKNKPPAGKGNVASFDESIRERFAQDVLAWLKSEESRLGVRIQRIAIDAPSHPASGERRQAELALDKIGISCHSTPTLARFAEKLDEAKRHLESGRSEASVPFAMHWWMLIGFELFKVLKTEFECIEVYPQAIVRTMGCNGAHKSERIGLDSQIEKFAEIHGETKVEVDSWIDRLGFGSRHDKFDALLSAWVSSLSTEERIALGCPPNDVIWIPKMENKA